MNGEVTVWYMTEEERLAYIAKHPIIPTEKPKGSSYVDATHKMVTGFKHRDENK
jgi:hypothetical protein